MDYVNLGRTGVKVSPLCFGTMNFARRNDEAQAHALLDRALDAGVNFVDTADIYGRVDDTQTGMGRSETMLGGYLKARGCRSRLVLATKGFGKMDPDDPNSGGLSRRHLIRACEASLKRLGVDHVDLYQLHSPSAHAPLDETLRALDDLVRGGKVRYIGTSNFPAWQAVEGLWTSSELKLNRFVSEQPPYSLVFRLPERDVLPMAQKHGLAVLPWSPLWGGFLSGKYRRGQDYPEGSRFEAVKDWGMWRDAIGERAWDLVELLHEIAGEKGCTVSQLALAWVAAQPGVTSTIIGPRTLEQLDDNLGALGVEVSEDDAKRIDAIARPRGHLLNL